MVDLLEYQRQQQAAIDAALLTILPPSGEAPTELSEAMRYAVFSGGKRIRPLLVIAAAEAVGGSVSDALLPAAAIELLHTYTLVHDDLPAMDDDELRRGKPTVHIQFGEANAILAGDGLQALAFATLADHPQAAALLRELGAAGRGVVAGQWVDMAVTTRKASAADIEFIHEHKTTDLIRTAVRMGGIVGHGTPEHLVALTAFGTAIGHLFQLTDDLLDIGTEEKPTAVTVYSEEGARERTKECLAQAEASLSGIPSPAILSAMAQFIFNRTT
jgi:geranylgeranyl pyrophosphate synthase